MSAEFRVAVLDDYQSAAETAAEWSALPAGVTVDFLHEPLAPELLPSRLAGYSAVVAMRERTCFDAETLAQLRDLRLLVTTGMRNASIDVDAAHRLGITVCGTRAGQSATVELTWALILGLVRGVGTDDRVVREGGWQTRVGGDLAGHTLGVVGLGRLGGRVAEIGRAFGMEVQAWSPHLTEERAAAASVRAVGRDELFATSEIITLHLVLSDSTRGIVGERELRAMRQDAFLVNAARAALVDQQALRSVLEEGGIAGAGLDVFDQEPLPADSWLRGSERTLLSPHMGYVTADNYRVMYRDAVEDIRTYLGGTPVRTLDPVVRPV